MRKLLLDKVRTIRIGGRALSIGIVTVAVISAIYVGYVLVSENSGAGLSDETAYTQTGASATEPEESELDSATMPWMVVLLVAMSVATVVSVSVSFYLYRWRRVLLDRPNLLVPEEWGRYLDDVGRNVNLLEKRVGLLSQEAIRNAEGFDDLKETFLSLQKALDERDEDNKRLKKGYDTEVYRRFLNRFIRVDQFVEACSRSDNINADSLSKVKRLIEDALEECGVEVFKPELGDDSRTAFGIADNPKTVRADRKDQDFKIVEVIESGYRLRGPDDYDVLVPAKVCIAMSESER